eukprot:TRINITY_DN16638_c2_g2_i1.p1 TRINITY_DN16638_c2_g2~~TRINITY_DN16638_c2_g2_i1.p1  ORF type:complete len:492 (+),score=132.41 TRINITY_DN16638_c2_g2_i1:96-1478(+)
MGNDPERKPARSLVLRLAGAPDLDERQRRALYLTVVLSLVGEFGTILDSLSIAAVKRSLAISDDGIAYIASAQTVAGLCGVGWGLLADIVGRRVMFLYGLPLMALQMIFTALATGETMYGLALIAGQCVPRPPAFAYLVEELDPGGRGALATLVAVGAALGAGAGLLLWAFVGDSTWGWRVLYLAQATAVLPFACAVHLADGWVPESRLFRPPTGDLCSKVSAPIASLWAKSRFVLLIFSLCTLIQSFTYVAPGKFLFDHLSSCGYHSRDASSMALLGGLVAMPVVIVCGRLSDHLGRVPMGAALWAGTGLSYAAFYSAPCQSRALPGAFVAVIVIAQFARSAVTLTLEQEVWKTEHRATAGAVYGLISGIFGAVGFAAYPLLSMRYGHSGALTLLSLCICSISAVWLFLPETAGRRLSSGATPQNTPGTEELAASSAEAEPLVVRVAAAQPALLPATAP